MNEMNIGRNSTEKKTMDEIAVLIPCYNESKTVEKVVTDFKRVLPDAVIYVYDNNSTDDTAKLAAQAGAVVRHEYRQGKGNVVRRMFQEIDADCYILVDGDDTYPAESAVEMVRLVKEHNADMVVGDRLSSTYFEENKRPFHNIGNCLVRGLVTKLFRGSIRDIMTGYRAFSYRFVKTFPILSCRFEIETEMSIHAIDKRMQVENVIIPYRDRPEGSVSKLNTFSDGWSVIKTLIRLFRIYNPFAFFGTISAALFFLSFVLFLPVLITYLKIGLVPRYPTLLVSGFLAVAAIQMAGVGISLQNMLHKNRQDFELELYHVEFQKRQGKQ